MPTKQEIEEEVLSIVKEHTGTDSIKVETNLRTEADCDSLDMVEIAMEIEDVFGIVIQDAKIESLHTVQDLVDAADQIVNKN